jgi:hypothetical protein
MLRIMPLIVVTFGAARLAICASALAHAVMSVSA